MTKACVKWVPRGIGLNFGLPDLRTGEVVEDRALPDISGFVDSKREGEFAVEIFGGNAFLDYREHEPNWIQVKVSCDEATLQTLLRLVQENDNLLTPEIVKEALDGNG